jgi:hypothetical protein
MKRMLIPVFATALGLTPLPSYAQTTFQGTGIIQVNSRHWETSVEIVKPRVSPKSPGSHGAIVGKISLSEPFTKPAPMPSYYEASAILTVYSQWPAKETVVFSGAMPVEPIFRPMVMPPDNEPIHLPSRTFRVSVGDPKDSNSLKLAPGNYRAEVVFHTQLHELTSTGRPPAKHEAGGAAIDFSVGAFNIAPVSDARGNVKIIGSVIPNRNATPTQIAAMVSAVSKEGQRVSATVQQFTEKHSRMVDVGPKKKPWSLDWEVASLLPVRPTGQPQPGFIHGYFVRDGESYTEQTSAISAELQKIVSAGNISRAMPGGAIRLQTTTNLKFTPKN